MLWNIFFAGSFKDNFSHDFKLDFLPKKNSLHFHFISTIKRKYWHMKLFPFFSSSIFFDTELFWSQHWIKWNLFIPIRLEIIILISLCQNRKGKKTTCYIYKHALDTLWFVKQSNIKCVTSINRNEAVESQSKCWLINAIDQNANEI